MSMPVGHCESGRVDSSLSLMRFRGTELEDEIVGPAKVRWEVAGDSRTAAINAACCTTPAELRIQIPTGAHAA
jgi:hypothetical protein